MKFTFNATLLFFLLTFGNLAIAQIKYQRSFGRALTQAKAQSKPIFVFFELSLAISQPSYSSGIDQPAVKKYFNKRFIN